MLFGGGADTGNVECETALERFREGLEPMPGMAFVDESCSPGCIGINAGLDPESWMPCKRAYVAQCLIVQFRKSGPARDVTAANDQCV